MWLTWFNGNIVTGAATMGGASQGRGGSVDLQGACGAMVGGRRRSAILWFIVGVRHYKDRNKGEH